MRASETRRTALKVYASRRRTLGALRAPADEALVGSSLSSRLVTASANCGDPWDFNMLHFYELTGERGSSNGSSSTTVDGSQSLAATANTSSPGVLSGGDNVKVFGRDPWGQYRELYETVRLGEPYSGDTLRLMAIVARGRGKKTRAA
jgi:hypothetical protein